MDDNLLEVRDMAMQAQKTADEGVLGISAHEKVCSERYANIQDRLKGIPRLFEILEGNKKDFKKDVEENKKDIKEDIKTITEDIALLAKTVYKGVGICISIPVIIEIVHHLGK